jgi:hypothetical protein
MVYPYKPFSHFDPYKEEHERRAHERALDYKARQAMGRTQAFRPKFLTELQGAARRKARRNVTLAGSTRPETK